jgi:hypothetical protein
MQVRCQRRYRAGFKVLSGWTSDDFVTGDLSTTVVSGNRTVAEIRIALGAPVVLWTLYNVQIRSVNHDWIHLSGIEPIETSRGTRWVHQHWQCEIARQQASLMPLATAAPKEEPAWQRATSTPATSAN